MAVGMSSSVALKMIEAEKINVICFFHTPGGKVRGAYICTKKGSEIDLDNSFFERYDLEEIWNVRGGVATITSTCDYKITDKMSDEVIYNQV
jgi:hypothetical protein